MRVMSGCTFVKRRGAFVLACVLAASLCSGCATLRGAPEQQPVAAVESERDNPVVETVVLEEDFNAPELPNDFEDAFWTGLVEDDAEQDLLPGEVVSSAPHDQLAEIAPQLNPEVLEQDPAAQVQPDGPPDPALRKAIEFCLKKLPRKPREAMLARLKGLDDRTLATELDMRVNTFLQNIVRARRLLRKCLEGKGVRLEEFQV